MTTHIALLRAVNLGAHNAVAMAELRGFLAGLGLLEPATILQSGNAVFRSDKQTPAALERLLETEATRTLGLTTAFFVRSAKEWREIVAANPFPDEARRDPSHLVLLCLKAAPASAAVAGLQASIAGREVVRAVGRAAYVVYPDGIGRSKLTIRVIEKKLGTAGTGRNWNTVLKLAALTGGDAAGRPRATGRAT
ncbi:MAG: DUF1697 domain-containing protein [Gemmatimonadales bacterium]